jgi:iron-sulfur cluster repair protein YtfE (RIC family)
MMLRRSDSQTNHYEHVSLQQELQSLEAALSELVCYSEVYTNLGSIGQVYGRVRKLREQLPTHFAHEEQNVLVPVAALSPEWEVFAREMRRQHLDLQGQLEAFCNMAEHLENASDLEDCICKLKEQGERFTRQMSNHMKAEDRKLSAITTNA